MLFRSTFQVERWKNRTEIKNEIEDIFGVKVANVRVLIKNGKKYVYVRLKPKFLAIDIATKMGLM